MSKGKLFIVSGPSGVGKGTVLKEMLKTRKNVFVSVSATTRPPRPGETNGKDYHFLDTDTFKGWIAQDAFLEYAEYSGDYYGTPKGPVDSALNEGKDVILEIEVQGALQIVKKRPEAVLIFVVPPTWEELKRRLESRGTDTPEKIQKRLQRAKDEFHIARTHPYHYFVLNDAVETAARELDAIMTVELHRSAECVEILEKTISC